ncbi:hypothetical protein AGABI2DRAFT_194253 [Agaricus bisporus var. bisporus H97]|uniref:hypothetical protein n=1 Tax=Agaricus bisporus var. bisporus (strain H97 / ATCC MYA-4626 / FGSC 10389) TaxID=936046 RepID=UPI00029F626C|nr:hypothetical protein AGABI2DRAFT_194253 [Agaricus bisporus var. bisporus H97]EKV45279.1 hypothetical protein AGABI2DRAFT_194253 [Agaricus bisporus var. bisporus H97]
MMLVHKQHAFHLPQAPLSHRRLSSAPTAIVVQPTRTPGLLSLSKPPQKTAPQRQLNANQRSAQHKSSPCPRPQQAHPQPSPALLNAAEITDKKTAVRPHKDNQKQAKAQSDSAKSSSRAHGRHARQPSPPALPLDPPQAEPTNVSDPFLDSFSPTTLKPMAPPKAANRRSQHSPIPALTIQTPTKAVAVPAAPRRASQKISRSVPTMSHSWDHICDDSNDEDHSSPPTTPLRSRPQNGIRSAPLSTSGAAEFPFHGTPNKKRVKNHKRAPSDHIFAMSSDDEATSGVEDLRALLNFVRSGSRPSSTSTPPPQRAINFEHVRSLSPASREKFFELEASKEVAGYFASSSFQNSPSPDDLPDPLFA